MCHRNSIDARRSSRAQGWSGLCGPKNTPAEIVALLNNEINAALADPQIRQRVVDMGGTASGGSPADFAKFIVEDTERWAKVVTYSHAKANRFPPSYFRRKPATPQCCATICCIELSLKGCGIRAECSCDTTSGRAGSLYRWRRRALCHPGWHPSSLTPREEAGQCAYPIDALNRSAVGSLWRGFVAPI
jgi:hypothetical protein